MQDGKKFNDPSAILTLMAAAAAVLFLAIGFSLLRLIEQAQAARNPNADLADVVGRLNGQMLLALALSALLVVTLAVLVGWRLRHLIEFLARRAEADLRAKIRDLERRLDERAGELSHERAQLRAVLETVQEGVIYAENNRILYINPALSRLTGYTLGAPAAGETDSLDNLYQSIASMMAREQSGKSNFRIRRKNGEDLDASVLTTQVNGVDGRPQGTLTIIRDHTREKALQQQKTRFVSNAAHELRTPIANLKTRLYLMRRQPEKMDEHAAVMEVVARMQELIEEMFDLSQFERGAVLLERQDVLLQDLVAEVVSTYQPKAQRRSLTLTCTFPSESLKVFVDPKRINQVLMNLISSAMNHTREGGTVAVRVKADPRSGDSVRYATVEIQDNGVGIAQDLLEQVFQPFSMAKHGDISSGTALGLTVSKEIVELHGGTIIAESEIGKGTLFTVRLALVET